MDISKMKTMQPGTDEYTAGLDYIIEKYGRLIHKLIRNTNNHDDYFNDCVLLLPNVINKWDPSRGAFSTFLTWQVRRHIQHVHSHSGLIKYNKQSETYRAKFKGKEFRPLNMNYVGVKFKDIMTDEEHGNYFFPKTHQTNTIDYDYYISKIEHIKNYKLWISKYIDNNTYVEIGKDFNITSNEATVKIRLAGKKIKPILEKLLHEQYREGIRGFKCSIKHNPAESIQA